MDVKEVVDEMRPYMKTSAENAAKVFEMSNFSHRIFDGTKTQLTPGMCEQVYTDMIIEVLTKKVIFCQRYGLVAIVIPRRDTDAGVEVDVELGMIFPEHAKTGEKHA